MDPKEKLETILGPKFGRLFYNATITKAGVVFPTKFQADLVANK